MKSIDLRHRLAAVLLAMCLVVCCALPAFATTSANRNQHKTDHRLE